MEYEIWRAEECKKIIQGNRLIRERNYKQKREVIVLNSKHKEEEMMSILKEERYHDVDVKKLRQKELEINYKQEKRKQNYSLCNELLESVMEIADIFYNHQQDDDRVSIDQRLFTEITKLFINGEAYPPVKKFRHVNPIENIRFNEEREVKLIFDKSETWEIFIYFFINLGFN